MPRASFAGLLVLALLGPAAAAPPASSDAITWLRRDGAPGWTSELPRSAVPGDARGAPLVATAWLPKLPSLKLTLARGGSLDLDATRGNVVLLDFWASWCGPCLAELPHLERLHAAEAGRGLVAVAVNANESAEIASAAARRLGLSMPVALDEPALYGAFRVRTLPTLVLADRQGRVRARWDGYRPGLETTIATKVAELLAGDPSGTREELAHVRTGAGALHALWYRDLPGDPEGVVVLPPSAGEDRRVIASSRGQLLAFDARGEATARSAAPSWAGRLLYLGGDAAGGAEVASFRPGATRFGVIAIGSGASREIAAPAAIVGLGAEASGADGHRLVLATLAGAAVVGGRDPAVVRLPGTEGVRDVAGRSGGGALLLLRDGSVAPADGGAAAWPGNAGDAARILVAEDSGAAVGPRTVIASAAGKFLPGSPRQLAVATYAGHVAVLDLGDGRLLFDAVWPDAHDLAAGDLDGDGLDELVVADDRRIAALSASPPARKP